MFRRAILQALTLGVAVCSCSSTEHVPGQGSSTTPSAGASSVDILKTNDVPTQPPDGMLEPAFADSDMVRDGFVYPRNIVEIHFDPEATHAQRKNAVARVKGRVVGGAKLASVDVYIVKIEHDGTTGPLNRAIKLLEGMPGVVRAMPHLMAGPA